MDMESGSESRRPTICKSGIASARKIWLSRHGESEYNQKGLIGGNSSLSERGARYAKVLPEALITRLPQDEPVSVAVWTSTLKRTIETARFIPFPKLRWKALDEIDAGICDGMSYEEIAVKYPHEYEARKKDKLRYRYPSGESYMDVIQRVEPVIIELERERESVLVVAHQAVLRAVYAYFMNVPPEDIPRLSMPLHTLIELTPMPDGTMSEQRFPVDIDRPAYLAARGAAGGGGPISEFIASQGSGVPGDGNGGLLERSPSGLTAPSAALGLSESGSPLSSMTSGASCLMAGASMRVVEVEAGVGGMALVPASPAPRSDSAEDMEVAAGEADAAAEVTTPIEVAPAAAAAAVSHAEPLVPAQ